MIMQGHELHREVNIKESSITFDPRSATSEFVEHISECISINSIGIALDWMQE